MSESAVIINRINNDRKPQFTIRPKILRVPFFSFILLKE